ncbi:chaperone modulator CbpM [Flavihumibacter sp. UBA7668]|uniref:chaperone modulator CbpM n=1 Tax=Flavihumibacter sp. UBA7668 TaxID=1946542 RepID=UPI0025C5DE63|nr:chaperone modulator CbpM [Flavihumibacter sp. UBA7668]
MEQENRITLQECCIHYKVESVFLQALGSSGLLELITYEDQTYITHDQLKELEKYMHLHYDLDINLAGIEAIKHLLDRVQELQQELKKQLSVNL